MKNIINLLTKAFSGKNKRSRYLVIMVCAVVYVALGILEAVFSSYETTSLFVSGPIRTILALIMTMTMCKAGFYCALILSSARIVNIVISMSKGYAQGGGAALISALAGTAVIVILYFVIFAINASLKDVMKENSTHEGLVQAAANASIQAQRSEKIIHENEEELYRLAYFDQLTELPNRVSIKKKIAELISQNVNFKVLFIGLDNFKAINESKGHEAGDGVLVQVAQKLMGVVDEDDFLGRLGGDEFAVVTVAHTERADCQRYISRLNHIFSSCIYTDSGVGLYMNASIGMASYPEDGDTYSDILKNADIALNKAKNIGKNCYVLFDRSMQAEIDFHNRVSFLMRNALEKQEFYLVYQPQFFPNKQLRGFEALLRWHSPELGNLSPVAFIPIAEENGFILRLGEWILNTACAKLKEITEIYGSEVIMSVNVSSIQFGDRNFMKHVTKALNNSGADSSQLELEITESLLLNSIEDTKAMLASFKRMNIKVSIDDFGTGYSSLSYLRKLPIDTLKIDKSFIDVVTEDANGKNIVNTIINLAHTLNLTVIAEGVEYTEQLDYLKTQECDCIQGYLFSKPLDGEDVIRLIKELKAENNEQTGLELA
ncbi:MAG: EAL domain-containing protein [Firmicutes bacterium]|nr:EAL domain-containing protein [[Eubacterium] siraeum]MCM1487523.1 EAL domain-containing protein [Bacillota bacterium]